MAEQLETYIRFRLGAAVPRTAALQLGEWMRIAVLSRLGRGGRLLTPPHLSGHDGQTAARWQHQHLYVLPTDQDNDGFLEVIDLALPQGFSPVDLTVLGELKRLYRRDGTRVSIQLESFYHSSPDAAVVWASHTPLVLTRYPRIRRNGSHVLNDRGEQIDGPEDSVRKEWALRQVQAPGLPDLVRVERLPHARLASGHVISWTEFARHRQTGSGATTGLAFGLRCQFTAPVHAPIAFGYACHFGLGQFRPV